MFSENRLIGYTQEQLKAMGVQPNTQTTTGATVQNGHLVGSGTPKPYVPPAGVREQGYVLNASFAPPAPRVLPNTGPGGLSLDVTNEYYSPRLLQANGTGGNAPLATRLADIDRRNAAVGANGTQLTSEQIAAEKASVAQQYQAEENIRLAKQNAERDKISRSITAAQGAQAPVSGNRLNLIAQARADERTGKITPEQLQQKITQINSSSPVASPAPVASAAGAAASPASPTNTPTASGTTPGGSTTSNGSTGGTTTEAAQGGTTTEGGTALTGTTDPAVGMALTQLPPEFQVLAPFLQQFFEQNEELQNENKTLFQAQMESLNKTYGTIEEKMNGIENTYKESSTAIQGLLETAKRTQDENLAKQQRAEQDRLAWEEGKLRREMGKQKAQQHDSMVAQIALSGGFGQDAGMRAVAESDAEYDQKMSDLTIAVGYQATDLNAKFSSLYQENTNNYVNKTTENMKELRSSLERIQMQGIQNTVAKQTAEQGLMKSAWDTQVKLREGRANKTLEIATDIAKTIREEKVQAAKDKQETYERSWEQFKYEQDNLYRYTSLDVANADRDDARELRRDDKEKYNSEIVRAKIVSQMEGNMVLDQYKQARTSWDSLDAAFKEKDNPFRDRAMAKSYEKLVEVGSVVMPGEYADITSNVPLASKILGKIQKVATGGQAWTDDERIAIRDLSKNLFTAYEKRRNEEAQIFNAAIQFHNQNTANPSYALSPSMFNLPEPVSSFTPQKFNNLLPPGYQSPFSSPNGGGGVTIPKENGRLNSGFLNGIVTGYGSKYWEAGLDVAAAKGTPITSPIEGVVEKVVYNPNWKGTPNNKEVGKSQNGGFGNQVVVRYPDGVKMQFSHADRLPFGKEMEGKKLQPNSTIAFVGNTGNTYGATGVHADITGYRSDGSKMTAKEVAQWLLNHSTNSYAPVL